MGKKLIITEKPSVAQDFARVLGVSGRNNGYIENHEFVITWCVGHLVEMVYPEEYDEKYKKWKLEDLPFLPREYKYGVIANVKKQYEIVNNMLHREDIETVYWAGDSGKEGQTIEENIRNYGGVREGMTELRVWIDSQTDEEIKRGITEAKSMDAYKNLGKSGIMRSIEDYAMGINFSRAMSVKYGKLLNDAVGTGHYVPIAVGRVMTCVLGMVVRREREIRNFVKTPFYRVLGTFSYEGQQFDGEWKAIEGSAYFQSPLLYKENGFKEYKDAIALCESLDFTKEEVEKGTDTDKAKTDTTEPVQDQNQTDVPRMAVIQKVEKKKEKKNPPLLFNLAELQNTCSKLFKISPDETLKIIQELYEKKLVTYPRTDARVLSTAVSKEIHKNIAGLRNYPVVKEIAEHILEQKSYQGIAKTRYVNDKQITDHYAIIPTGQGFGAIAGLNLTAQRIYEVIVRRFLCIFYPPAEYLKLAIIAKRKEEAFFANFKVMTAQGYLAIASASFSRTKAADKKDNDTEETQNTDSTVLSVMQNLKKGMEVELSMLAIKEGETSPPKRYNSGSMILAMENAGQLIEDEELRSQIKSNGIGTSATRAEILSKLVKIRYLKLNKKTQIITPELLGEMVYDVVNSSIRSLLNPELTASWELGLTQVADGKITSDEYMEKLNGFITRRVDYVKHTNNQYLLKQMFEQAAVYYKK